MIFLVGRHRREGLALRLSQLRQTWTTATAFELVRAYQPRELCVGSSEHGDESVDKA